MQRKASQDCPRSCFHCELFSNTCDICNTHNGHCMKFHIAMECHLSPCHWRSMTPVTGVQKAIDLANQQLAAYFGKRHDAKQRGIRLRSSSKKSGHARGHTGRLTATPDIFKTT